MENRNKWTFDIHIYKIYVLFFFCWSNHKFRKGYKCWLYGYRWCQRLFNIACVCALAIVWRRFQPNLRKNTHTHRFSRAAANAVPTQFKCYLLTIMPVAYFFVFTNSSAILGIASPSTISIYPSFSLLWANFRWRQIAIHEGSIRSAVFFSFFFFFIFHFVFAMPWFQVIHTIGNADNQPRLLYVFFFFIVSVCAKFVYSYLKGM